MPCFRKLFEKYLHVPLREWRIEKTKTFVFEYATHGAVPYFAANQENVLFCGLLTPFVASCRLAIVAQWRWHCGVEAWRMCRYHCALVVQTSRLFSLRLVCCCQSTAVGWPVCSALFSGSHFIGAIFFVKNICVSSAVGQNGEYGLSLGWGGAVACRHVPLLAAAFAWQSSGMLAVCGSIFSQKIINCLVI